MQPHAIFKVDWNAAAPSREATVTPLASSRSGRRHGP